MPEIVRRDQVLQQLTTGVAELTSSDAWRDWLDVQSRFHQYSFGNCLLILRQRPDATHVAGFHTWRALGRRVRRGEKGIWILAPVTRRVASDDDEGGEQRPARVLTGFRAVPVFDVAQTDGDPLPDVPARRLRGDAPDRAYEQLVGVAHAIGFTVEEQHLPGERNGDCSFELRRIRIEAANDGAQQLKTLAHELAHAMLHERAVDRALAELEAESVAYVVCHAIGVATDAYSFGYVASWAGGGDHAVAAIRASAQRIQQTANRILQSIESREQVAA
jgi:antirestriction protein ArdC